MWFSIMLLIASCSVVVVLSSLHGLSDSFNEDTSVIRATMDGLDGGQNILTSNLRLMDAAVAASAAALVGQDS